MQRIALWRRQFNWRMLLMRVIVNALALLVTTALLPGVFFVDRTVRNWIVLAIFLGVLNALVKPIIQFLTLRFIFATYGLVVALINAVLLVLLQFLFPDRFAIQGVIFGALLGGALIGIVSAVLENLLGITPPIVSEKYPELRQRIKDRETGSVEAYITQTAIEKTLEPKPGEQPEVSQTEAAAAVLAVVGSGGDAASNAAASHPAAAPVEPEPSVTVPAGQEA